MTRSPDILIDEARNNRYLMAPAPKKLIGELADALEAQAERIRRAERIIREAPVIPLGPRGGPVGRRHPHRLAQGSAAHLMHAAGEPENEAMLGECRKSDSGFRFFVLNFGCRTVEGDDRFRCAGCQEDYAALSERVVLSLTDEDILRIRQEAALDPTSAATKDA